MISFSFRSIREAIRSYRGAVLVALQSMGLWEGKQFRMYRSVVAATQLQFVCARDFILSDQTLYVDEGTVQVRILTGATPAGTFTDISTQTGKNRLGTVTYVQLNFMKAGGTFTGGTEREIIRADAGVGPGNAFSNIASNVRVLPAGTYYFDITVVGTSSGIYSFEWEELGSVNGVVV